MGKIMDWIKSILSSNKKNAQLYVERLEKTYGDPDQLEVGLYEDDKPLAGKTITINVNGKDYQKVTDEDGIARLSINLQAGLYTPLITFSDDEYKLVTAHTNILIKAKPVPTRMEGTDINMIYKDGTKYQCAVYDANGRVAGDVDITVNGRTYRKNCDETGLYKLTINLNPGDYTVNANYLGDAYHLPSNINNTIHINEVPKPQPQTQPVNTTAKVSLKPYITERGGGKLGQTNDVRCGPHMLMQCIYRLTGIELSEAELASVCGTTSAGTSHQGLATGVAWFNRKYGYNIKMEWRNFSDVGWNGLANIMDDVAFLFHLCYRRKWGHYEGLKSINGSNLVVLNSLGDYCGYPAFCGYLENRSKATQESYINDISQKSLCILRL